MWTFEWGEPQPSRLSNWPNRAARYNATLINFHNGFWDTTKIGQTDRRRFRVCGFDWSTGVPQSPTEEDLQRQSGLPRLPGCGHKDHGFVACIGGAVTLSVALMDVWSVGHLSDGIIWNKSMQLEEAGHVAQVWFWRFRAPGLDD